MSPAQAQPGPKYKRSHRSHRDTHPWFSTNRIVQVCPKTSSENPALLLLQPLPKGEGHRLRYSHLQQFSAGALQRLLIACLRQHAHPHHHRLHVGQDGEQISHQQAPLAAGLPPGSGNGPPLLHMRQTSPAQILCQMGGSAGMQPTPLHHLLQRSPEGIECLARADSASHIEIHQLDIAADAGHAHHLCHDIGPAGHRQKGRDRPRMRKIKRLVLKGETLQGIGLQEFEIGGKLAAWAEPRQRRLQRRAVNIEPYHLRARKFQRHLPAPDTCPAGHIKDGARLAQARKIIATQQQPVEMMLEVKPVPLHLVFRHHIRGAHQHAPPTEPRPTPGCSLPFWRAAAKPAQKTHDCLSFPQAIFCQPPAIRWAVSRLVESFHGSVTTDQSRTLPSRLPVASKKGSAASSGAEAAPGAAVPWGQKATRDTASLCPLAVASSRPVSTDQSRAVLSCPPVARMRLSGLKATLRMLSWCPVRRRATRPLCSSQTSASPISRPPASHCPSGLKAMLFTHPSPWKSSASGLPVMGCQNRTLPSCAAAARSWRPG